MAQQFELESILDLNSNNIWNLSETEVAKLWEHSKSEENFTNSEDKLLNVLRLAFEVVHYNADDVRQKDRYEDGTWALMTHCNPGKLSIALRKKNVTKLTDLSYENVKHITAATLLELIDRNFGGGWDSISLPIKDIIESGFDISTTQLPASRIHKPGGTLDRKVAQGYDVLEITKGTWIEAIFAKKKDPIEKLHFVTENKYDEDGNPLDDENDENLPDSDNLDDELEDGDEEDEDQNDDTFYSSYSPEAEVKDEDEEGFPIEED